MPKWLKSWHVNNFKFHIKALHLYIIQLYMYMAEIIMNFLLKFLVYGILIFVVTYSFFFSFKDLYTRFSLNPLWGHSIGRKVYLLDFCVIETSPYLSAAPTTDLRKNDLSSLKNMARSFHYLCCDTHWEHFSWAPEHQCHSQDKMCTC